MRTKILAVLLTLGFALWGVAAWADEFTKTAEPFARSAEIYTEGYQAFGPPENVPTPGDFVAVMLGDQHAVSGRPWFAYQLREPGRFQFELQPMEELRPSVGN